MSNFFHRLFNPHCQHCKEERECAACANWKDLFEQEREEKLQLLEKLFPTRNLEVNEESKEIEPIRRGKHIPWAVRQQMLEEEDREVARRLREKEIKDRKDIEELEKKLGVSDASQEQKTA